MTGPITLVVEYADLERIRRLWKIDELAKELVKAGVASAPLFHGRLEDAPDSTAYIVFASRDDLAARLATEGLKDRLARSIGTDAHLKNACRVAMELGLAGILDDRPLTWGHPAHGKPSSACGVKRDVATTLHWDVWDINASQTHALTKQLPMTCAEMLVKYLGAALPTKV